MTDVPVTEDTITPEEALKVLQEKDQAEQKEIQDGIKALFDAHPAWTVEIQHIIAIVKKP